MGSDLGLQLVRLVVAMEASIDRIVAGLTTSGAVGAIANRRAFRVGGEPLDLFRRYMTVYAPEQAYRHFSAGFDRQSRALLGRPEQKRMKASFCHGVGEPAVCGKIISIVSSPAIDLRLHASS